MKKPHLTFWLFLFVLLGVIVLSTLTFLHLFLITTLRTQGVTERLARLIGSLLYSGVAGVVIFWMLSLITKPMRRQPWAVNTLPQKILRLALYLVPLWIAGKPLLWYGLEQAGLQDSWWAHWVDDSMILLLLGLSTIFWWERRQSEDK